MESSTPPDDTAEITCLLSLASASQQPYVTELLSFTLDWLHKGSDEVGILHLEEGSRKASTTCRVRRLSFPLRIFCFFMSSCFLSINWEPQFSTLLASLSLSGNFFRIRSAFKFGAKRLARLLSCPKEDMMFELNQFFMNTWERHVHGIRPDAPACDFQHPIPSNIDQSQLLNSYMGALSSRENERSSAHESVVEVIDSSYNHSIQHSQCPSESTSAKTQKGHANQNNSRMSDRSEKGGSNSEGTCQSEGTVVSISFFRSFQTKGEEQVVRC